MTRITVACLDMAGTTVHDDGSVLAAFSAAIAAQDLPVAAYNQAMTDVRSSMGQSGQARGRAGLGGRVRAASAARRRCRGCAYAARLRAGIA